MPSSPPRAPVRTPGTQALSTASTRGGTCRSACQPPPGRGKTHAGAGSRTSRRRLPEHFVEPVAQPAGILARERLSQRRPRDQDIVAAGRHSTQPLAPRFAQTALHAVPVDRATRALRNCDPEPGFSVVLPRKPVQDEEPCRDRPAVAVDRIEVAGAREAMAALHDSAIPGSGTSGGEPLPAFGAATLEDRAAGAGRHASAKAVLALPPAHVGLIGPLHKVSGARRRRPEGPRAGSIDEVPHASSPQAVCGQPPDGKRPRSAGFPIPQHGSRTPLSTPVESYVEVVESPGNRPFSPIAGYRKGAL